MIHQAFLMEGRTQEYLYPKLYKNNLAYTIYCEVCDQYATGSENDCYIYYKKPTFYNMYRAAIHHLNTLSSYKHKL